MRKELTACLRSGRTCRRPHGRKDPGGYIRDLVLIADRPAEIEDRAVPGHWEGDLLLGARGQSAIATLVERQTRYVMLLAVGRDKTSRHVCALIAKKIRTLPQHLAVSLTWDRGKEMAGHRQFSIATGVEVYFCDPHSPWQRGTNENTNGLLRQYFPRGTDLSGDAHVREGNAERRASGLDSPGLEIHQTSRSVPIQPSGLARSRSTPVGSRNRRA